MLNSRATKTAVVLVAGALIASTLVAASPAPLSATTGATGDLDTTFDTDGWNTISGTGLWFEAASVVVQSSGKVVVAGARMNGSQFDPLIARFNTDGSLDTTFGSDGTGIVVEPWPNATIMEWVNRSGAAVDVALLSDDRIVVTSSPSGDNEKHGIMLFTSDGVLDTSFDGDGRRKIASGGPNMDVWTTAVTVTSDDKIMIVGTSPDNGWDYRMKVYRLNTDGSNDTSFNNDGMRNVYFPSSVDNLANAVVMSGDKTVFGGSAADSWSRHDMGIGQLTSDGRNDTALLQAPVAPTSISVSVIPMFGNCSFKLTARSSESASRRSSTTTTLSQSRASTPTDRWTRRFPETVNSPTTSGTAIPTGGPGRSMRTAES